MVALVSLTYYVVPDLARNAKPHKTHEKFYYTVEGAKLETLAMVDFFKGDGFYMVFELKYLGETILTSAMAEKTQNYLTYT
jgi:hypothetical protein